MNLIIGTWNAEWATLKTKAGPRIAETISQINSDIFVLTEGSRDLLPSYGEVVDGGTNWGYQLRDSQHRKVLVWSKNPWRDIDQVGSTDLPPGRFVAGTTSTELGDIRVFGVCIPWQSAHTNTGNKNRKNWQDHETYLDHLKPLIIDCKLPLVVAGDFNQRIPKGRQPQRVFDSLMKTFEKLTISTLQSQSPALIDHIAHTKNFRATELEIVSDADHIGKLSDHRGAVIRLHRNQI
jgi:endonuclease/exonuclease/phosphatase family metal-dependent hydrolase